LAGALAALVLAASCVNGPAVLREQVEARDLAGGLHVQFANAVDAANRAVMADTDEASAAAAHEAEQSTGEVLAHVKKLQRILNSLGYSDEISQLNAFTTRFDEFRKLDTEILPLAVQNTNLKAQRLSFGGGRDAVAAFRAALAAAAKKAGANGGCCGEAQRSAAVAALLEIEVIEAQHIAETEPPAMSRMEEQMASLEAAAHRSLDALRKMTPPAAATDLDTASAALDRFNGINAEIVRLSRLNSNVRSLALAMGRKRTVTAECDDALRALEEALSKHEFRATR
jgi:hypothetical protein